jgi:spore coat protein A, manganese oxidase
MKFTRRNLLQAGGMAAAGLALPKRGFGTLTTPPPLLSGSPAVARLWPNRFTESLGVPPVALPDQSKFVGVDYYELGVRQFSQALSKYMSPTTFWGYNIEAPQPYIGSARQGYLGGNVIATKGRPVKLHIQNFLTNNGLDDGTPLTHVIRCPGTSVSAVDNTIAGSPYLYNHGNTLENRIATHLHGGQVSWDNDGHPLSWYSNNPFHGGATGPYFQAANNNIYTYPNNQSARLVWYHDHAESITRLNAYAGIATGYIIRDTAEHDMIVKGTLPPLIESSIVGGYDIQEFPLVIQEKMFDADDQLYYHCLYDPARWQLNTGTGTTPPPYPSCIPEFFGDVTLVNGVPWPNLQVKKGIYRFRMLAAAQARFYNLQLFYAKTGFEANVPDFGRPGPQFYQIGTEGGFLPAPVRVTKLLLAPAERADVLIDFSGLNPGDKLILYSKAPAPYPGGDPVNDYMDTRNQISMPGTIMQFEVIDGDLKNAAKSLPATLPTVTAIGTTNIKVVPMSLNEGWDGYGRLQQLIGSFNPSSLQNGGFGTPFVVDPGGTGPGMPILWETHKAGDIEEWTIVNNTGDVHPMHFHLEDVQIVSRQAIDMVQFNTKGTIRPVGPAMGPDPNERGWKETVRCYPGQVIRVRMKFDSGFKGHYVWHCHILEHEEHDMMHEFEVV